MSNKYLLKKQYECTDRNKLDTDVRNYCAGAFDGIIMSETQLKDAWKMLKHRANEYNEKYPRVSKKIAPQKMDLDRGKETTLLIVSDVLHYIAYKVRRDDTVIDEQNNLVAWMWAHAMQAEETGFWITESTEPGVIKEPISSFDLVLEYRVR